ncbi:MAG: glycosyltransferase family 39 protein [Candidatus Eisenbacteria bacterium]|nr:glycosyltransferase family 39 protein [Candidatus Eisenbacteria bacterium]
MIVVVLAAGLLLWVVLGPHKIGDYYTETDFYGSYAEGARLIQAGHLDPSRYAVVGPVFDAVVAAVGLATRDLFTAAELVAVLAACGTLILWFLLVARLAGSGLALWTMLFLAVNPTFFRYGYSVTTDALGTFVQAAALLALLVGRRGLAPLWAGALAALAALTRYNAVYLFPGALLYYACFDRGRSGSRLRALVLFLVGFAVVILPWLGLSLQSGQMPGGALFHNIAYDIYSSKGISWERYAVQVQPEISSLRDVALHAPAVVLRREFTNLFRHLALDVKLLLGWQVAVWCMFGLILSLWDGTWRRFLPVWMMGALLFITLVPAIHSERYSLPLAPVYLTLAGVAAASPRLVPVVKGWLFPLKWVLALLPLLISGAASLNTQREVLHKLPVEVLEAAKVLDRAAPRGTRILARKPHIAYAAGFTLVPFPAVGTLPELAQYCLREKVEFIYFSWPEANTRAYFTYLLDPEAQVPGLRVERFFPSGPAVLYRIEPGFGTTPEWFASDSLRTVHVTRAITSMGATPWRVPYICGTYAYEQGQFAAALGHFNLLMQSRPGFAEAYFLAGQAYAGLGQLENAAAAYARALELQPDYPEARLRLGWTELKAGRPRNAARTWRPIVGAVRDSSSLVTMIGLYERLGDRQAALKARETFLRRRLPR